MLSTRSALQDVRRAGWLVLAGVLFGLCASPVFAQDATEPDVQGPDVQGIPVSFTLPEAGYLTVVIDAPDWAAHPQPCRQHVLRQRRAHAVLGRLRRRPGNELQSLPQRRVRPGARASGAGHVRSKGALPQRHRAGVRVLSLQSGRSALVHGRRARRLARRPPTAHRYPLQRRNG